ncbi:MAG: hypothetical protein WAK40_05760 [Thermoplasmata archaeon]
MAQFIVRVYPAPSGLRVVVDGMTHFDTDRTESVESLASEAILSRLRAFLPPRAAPPLDPAAVSTLYFEIALRRVGVPGLPGTSATAADDRHPPDDSQRAAPLSSRRSH